MSYKVLQTKSQTGKEKCSIQTKDHVLFLLFKEKRCKTKILLKNNHINPFFDIMALVSISLITVICAILLKRNTP